MLYLLKLPQITNEGTLDFILKFGFTDNWEQRYKSYTDYHKNIIVLKTYEDGTINDETQVKIYLEKFCIYRKEWFKYCPEVLEFFEKNDTLEKLRETTKNSMPFIRTMKIQEVNRYVVKYIETNIISQDLTISDRIQQVKDITDKLKILMPKDHIRYLSFVYSKPKSEITNFIEDCIKSETNIKESVFLFYKEFNKTGNTSNKLKMLVEFGEQEEITKEDMEDLFQLIPAKYKDYYTILGPDRLRTHRFREIDIKREILDRCGNVLTEGDVITEIYKTFEVGKRYTKADIKETLKGLYQRLGYSKTAKANDLESYFYLKGILTPDKKAGFEIIGKK